MEMGYWKGGWICIIHGFMSSPSDVYVAAQGCRKSIRYSVADESKEHFLDLDIDSILFNALMHGTVNSGLYRKFINKQMIIFPTCTSGASHPQFHHKMKSFNIILNYTC